MALDISAIANLREGGILTIGVSTERDEYDIDRVDATVGASRLRLSVPRIEQILDNLIFPTMDGIVVSVFPNQSREILAILVPPQDREKYPFLVKGFVHEESDFWSNGFTWVEKRSGAKKVIQISEIHRLISRSLAPQIEQLPEVPPTT